MVAALARFGRFSNLGLTASSPSDVDPNTATLSFHGAQFGSDVISFTGAELQSNQVRNGRRVPLDTLDAADESLLHSYDAPPYVRRAALGRSRLLISAASI